MLAGLAETKLKENKMRVLVVEDDAPLNGGLCSVLELAGYRASACENGLDASYLLAGQSYDLVVLDLGLPGLDGLEVLRRLRSQAIHTPVLILSARDQTQDRVLGLDTGADDYLNKPFERTEFEARVRALLRRGRSPSLQVGSLNWSWQKQLLTVHGDTVILTRNEAAIMDTLMRSPGKIVSKQQLAQCCATDHEPVSHNEVEVYIYRLRRKLTMAADIAISTVRGLGYYLQTQVTHA